MTAVFINAIFLIAAFVLGYVMRPRISRKISYKKRGIATRQRAAMKRSMKEPVVPKTKTKVTKDTYLPSTPTSLN